MLAFARAQETLRRSFPPAYRAMHRAIVTVGRRQYVCDGFLVARAGAGLHLAMVSSLGLVAEARLRADGEGEVLKVTPLFRESWTRQYVLRDLRWLFAPPDEVHPVGGLPDGRLVLGTAPGPGARQARYVFSADGRRWEGLELADRGGSKYSAALSQHRSFGDGPQELPTEFSVDAGAYRLHLRVVEWRFEGSTQAATTTTETGP